MVIVLEKLILQKQFVEIVRRFNLKTKSAIFQRRLTWGSKPETAECPNSFLEWQNMDF